MVTYEPEYIDKLWEIENMGLLKRAVLPLHNEKVMNIDLNTRKVEVPEFLSVEKDHQSETIYFKFDRYYDMVDLTSMTCAILYTDAKGEEYVYPVPFYDVKTYAAERKVLIPWCIQGPATAHAGNVTFSIVFFKIDQAKKILSYSLNTLPATGKVLEGSGWDLNDIKYSQITIDNTYLEIIQRIAELDKAMNIYWLDV